MNKLTHSFLQKNTRVFPISAFASVLSAWALLTTARLPSSLEILRMTSGSKTLFLRNLAKLHISIGLPGLISVLIAFALFVFYTCFLHNRSITRKKLSVSALILSCLFSLIMLVGMNIQTFDSLAFIGANTFQTLCSFLLFLGFGCFFYCCIETLFDWLDHKIIPEPIAIHACNIPCAKSSRFTLFQKLLLDKKPLLFPMLFLFLCWLPIWIIYFPGSIMWDIIRQFNVYFGVQPWSNHDPLVGTFLYGTLMYIGRALGSDNWGIFLCTLYQHILLCACMAYNMSSLKKWGVGITRRFAVLLFYALCPIVSFWPSSAMKDCTAFGLVLLFGTLLIHLIRALRQRHSIQKPLFQITLVGILIPLIRHDGLYICLITMALSVFLSIPRKAKLACLASAVAIFVVSNTITNAAISATNAIKGCIAEALAIPFQQTARYVKKHRDEVTAAERSAIDAVLDYERLAEIYDPDKSDPVKDTYRNNDDALPEYFSVWGKMFLKHPTTYIEATLCNSYSYYYPYGESTDKPIVYAFLDKNPAIYTGFFDVNYTFKWDALRDMLSNKFLPFIKNLPIIGMLLHTGSYTWTLLLGIGYVIHRKRSMHILWGFVPAILNIFVCICSPVNGYFRYFMPTILLTPMVICWMLEELKSA